MRYTKEQIREAKKRLISIAIACYPGLPPIEVAEKAIQSLEDFEMTLNDIRVQTPRTSKTKQAPRDTRHFQNL